MVRLTNLSPSRSALRISQLLAGLLLIVLAALMWSQPALADELDFYRAAASWQLDRHLIPHPPGYVHFLQLVFLVFGRSIPSARLLGVASALVVLAMMPPMIRLFSDRSDEDNDWIAVAAIWLYVGNPMTVQNMMLLDIDNTILMPMLLWLLWLWKAGEGWTASRQIVAVGLVFAVSLWVKLPTTILLMACIGAFHLLRGQMRRTAQWALAALVGGVVFAGTMAIYSQFTGFGFDFVRYTIRPVPFGSTEGIRRALLLLPQGLGVFVMWLSVPASVLLFAVLAMAGWRLLTGVARDYELLAVYVAAVVVFYALVLPPAWGYPRYQAPTVPIIAMLLAACIVPAFLSLPRRGRVFLGCLGPVVFVYMMAVIGDVLWPLYDLTFVTDTGDLGQRLSQGARVFASLAIPILGVLVAVAIMAWHQRLRLIPTGIVALGVLSFALSASTTGVQVLADYSTRYRYTYDYDDFYRTVDDLKATDGYIIAVKDVLFYTGLPGEDAFEYTCSTCSPQRLAEVLRSGRVAGLAWTTKEESRSRDLLAEPAVAQPLNDCFSRTMHGVFVVYRHTGGDSCP